MLFLYEYILNLLKTFFRVIHVSDEKINELIEEIRKQRRKAEDHDKEASCLAKIMVVLMMVAITIALTACCWGMWEWISAKLIFNKNG